MRSRRDAGGKVQRVRSGTYGRGKRYLAVWRDESGRERTEAYATKAEADARWKSMDTDRSRGEYTDPRAGRELLTAVAGRWLASRVVDPASMIRYEAVWRLHIEPTFGHRQVKAIRPSDIQVWLAKLGETAASRPWRARSWCCRARWSWPKRTG